MGLLKPIQLNNGLTVNYHRIVSINKVTNLSNIIEIASYVSKSKRQEEIDNVGQPIDIFIYTAYESVPYDENSKITEVYDYLKTIERFKDAEDC